MPLLDYEGTRPWTRAIRQAVLLRQMPPWFADPAYGHFSNDRSLSQQDIRTVVNWVDHGAPAGDRRDAPPLVHWTPGWSIGKPEIVLEMPVVFEVPKSGVLPYQYVILPTRSSTTPGCSLSKCGRETGRIRITSSRAFVNQVRRGFAENRWECRLHCSPAKTTGFAHRASFWPVTGPMPFQND